MVNLQKECATVKKAIVLSALIMFIISLTVFAGSIDVELAYVDEALVFIGSVDDYKITHEEDDYINTEYSLTVTPVRKIKGEVEVNKPISFEKVNGGGLKLQKDTNYLFGYLPDQLYIWELETYNDLFDWELDDYTDASIILKERHNDTISEGMQDFLNNGVFERAEKERQDIGKQISFVEFLSEDIKTCEKIVFSFKNTQFEVAKEKFLEVADEIYITNVKNETVYDTDFDDILFIMGVKGDSTTMGEAYGAITPLGEVDRYGQFMSRLMAVDYKMEIKDVKKLYGLFPKNLEDQLPDLGVNGGINTIYYIVFAAVVLAVIIFAVKKKGA